MVPSWRAGASALLGGGLVHLVDDFVRGGNLAEFYINCDANRPNFVILVHGLLEKHYISRVF